MEVQLVDILKNSYVVTSGSVRFEQFKKTFDAVGLDSSIVNEWRWCHIESSGQLGNAVSQYSLVRYALQVHLPFLVVFEDDAVPCNDAAQKLIEAFKNKDDKTLCLSLGWSADSDPELGDDRCAKRRVYGSHAYVLFGDEAYNAYISAWEKDGRADVVLGHLLGSKLNRENLFAQHTIGDESIHLPPGWTLNATDEHAVDKDINARYSKADAAIQQMYKDMTMNVIYTVDIQGQGAQQFIDQLLVSIASLRFTQKRDAHINVVVLFWKIPAELMSKVLQFNNDKFKVEFQQIPQKMMEFFQSCSKVSPTSIVRSWSGIVYARLFSYMLLPNIDKALYVDVDTMFRKPIDELWHEDLGDCIFGCTRSTVYEYGFSSGTMLIDMKKLREDKNLCRNLQLHMAKYSKNYYLPDQTTLNEFFKGKIHEIDQKYGYPPTPGKHDKDKIDNAVIWHFYEGTKPIRLKDDDHTNAMLQWNKCLDALLKNIK